MRCTDPWANPPEGCWYDEAAARAAVEFFPGYLRHTEAEWAGRPFVLADWQAKVVGDVYGWKRADGTRRYRRVWMEVARKNGKTELAAGVSLLALVADGEMGAQCYSTAVDKDQAKIVFEKAGSMVGLSPELSQVVEVYKTSLYCPELMASFKPLSRSPGSKHGFSPSFNVGDEVHEWPSGELAQVVRDGMGARRQPLEWFITTAGKHGEGFAWEQHEYALQVLSGEVADDELYVAIFAADEEDDWTDEATWAKANPNLGISPKLEFLRSQVAQAKQLPRLENNFRRYHLNQWTSQATRWLPMAEWDAAAAGRTSWERLPEMLRGRACYSGLDLASVRDLTAACHLFPPVEEGEPTWALWRFWLPERSLDGLPDRLRRRYDAWVKAGALTLTPGNVADYRWITEALRSDADTYKIRCLGVDPWNATQPAVELQEDGLTVEFVRQGYGSLSAPSKELERLVMSHELAHGGNPLARWCADNVAITDDPAGNIKPSKEDSAGKIDGIAAAVTALAVMLKADPDEGPSVYEGRGLLMV